MTRAWLEREDRGLAMGLIGFFAILVVTALLYTMLNPAITEIISFSSDQATSTQAHNVIDERAQIWGYMPMYGVFLGVVFLLSRAVFESMRPG